MMQEHLDIHLAENNKKNFKFKLVPYKKNYLKMDHTP